MTEYMYSLPNSGKLFMINDVWGDDAWGVYDWLFYSRYNGSFELFSTFYIVYDILCNGGCHDDGKFQEEVVDDVHRGR